MLQTPAILYESQRGIDIYVNNLSTTISADELRNTMRAIQIQITRDFFPVWGINANLQVYDVHRAYNQWQIVILDNSDVANELGYHDVTSTGNPLGKVFVNTAGNFNFPWSVVFSHEILEMLVDPYCELAAFNQDSQTTGQLIAYEVCDPVQAHGEGYQIGSVEVANFVYPGWFESSYPAGSKVDFLNALPAPLTLGSGGYISLFNVNPTTTGWTQVTAASRSIGDPMPSKERLALRNKVKGERVLSNPMGAEPVIMSQHAALNPANPKQVDNYHAHRMPLSRTVKR